jgi:dTDP-4-dehydrorhamnose 3,5-epimerase
MEIIKTKLDGLVVIKTPSSHVDKRGTIDEFYRNEWLESLGINVRFVQDTFSISRRGVLRGIHGDSITYKYVSCLWGEVYAVIVNYDKNSPQYLQWDSFLLSSINGLHILVPPKFGNSYLVLSNTAVYHYKMSQYYSGPENQFTINPFDQKLNIPWPISNPILLLSKRDAEAPFLS